MTETEVGLTGEPAADDAYKWQAFTAIAISFVTMVLSMSMVFVALSSIAEEFDVTLRTVSWVVIVQALTITALMMPMGRLADMIGRRRVHLIGLVLFGSGSIACALSPSMTVLLIARVVQSIGSSMGQSVGSAMVVSVFPPEERGKAIGSQSTAVAIGAACGPILGGLVLQVLSWRALFIIVAIPIVVAYIVGYRILDEARVTPDGAERHSRFDMTGAVLSSLAVLVIVLTMNNPTAADWLSPLILTGAGTGVALLAAFVWWERRISTPMLPLGVFRNRLVATAVATRVLGFMAGTAAQLLLPVFLISYRGMSEATAGSVMFLSAVGLGVSGQLSGRLADRFGERPFLIGGFAALVMTSAAMWSIEGSTPLALVACAVLGNGLAQGTWSVPNSSLIMGNVPRSMLGIAGALSNLTRNVGQVLGQAVASAVVTAIMVRRGFDIALDEIDETPGADEAFIAGWGGAFTVVVGLAATALLVSLSARVRAREPVGVPM